MKEENRGNESNDDTDVTIDDVRKVSEIGPIRALLTPAAEVLGDRLKSSVERWLDETKAKNIQDHASKVLSEPELDELSEQSQLELFDWAERAGRISPSETERAASVRAALKATLDGDYEDAQILMGLKKIGDSVSLRDGYS